MPNRTEVAAMEYIKNLLNKNGMKCQDTSRDGKGYDLEVIDGERRIKLEVAGTQKECKIPDRSAYEFDNSKRLKADYLVVVGNCLSEDEERVYFIPRDAIRPENLRLKQSYHIARFQSCKNMGRFLFVGPDLPWIR